MNDLRFEARKAWREYGEAICRAFGFPPGTIIVADELEQALKTFDDEKVKKFTNYVREKTWEVLGFEFTRED